MSYGDVDWLVRGVGWANPHQGYDFAATGLGSAFLYGLAAAGLTYSLVADFDSTIDRPRSSLRDSLLDDARWARKATVDQPEAEAASEVSAGEAVAEDG